MRLQRPARGHRSAGHRRRDAVLAPSRPHPAASPAGHLPPAADRGRDPTAAADRARRLRLPQRGELRPGRRRRPAAARAAGQRPQASATSAPPSGPGTWTGPRPPPAPGACSIPRTRRPQAPRPHGRTSIRATQDLPETNHDVPARPGRMRKPRTARPRRTQPAPAPPPPRGKLTIKGPPPAARLKHRPRPALRIPCQRSPDPPISPGTALCDRLICTASVQYVPMPRSRTPARGAEGCLFWTASPPSLYHEVQRRADGEAAGLQDD
jgi:hypothetical protein